MRRIATRKGPSFFQWALMFTCLGLAVWFWWTVVTKRPVIAYNQDDGSLHIEWGGKASVPEGAKAVGVTGHVVREDRVKRIPAVKREKSRKRETGVDSAGSAE